MIEPSTPTPREILLQSIEDLENQDISSFDISETYSLASCIPKANEIKNLFRLLKVAPLDRVPDNLLSQMTTIANQCRSRLRYGAEFCTKQPPVDADKDAQWKSRVYDIDDGWMIAYNIVVPTLTYLATTGDHFKDGLSGLSEKAAEIQNEMKKDSTELLSQMKIALQSVQDMSTKAGVSAFAANFGAEKDKYEQSSWLWFRATLAIGGLLIAYIFWFFEPLVAEVRVEDWHSAFVYGFSKLVVLSVGFFLMVLCGRNYTASKHNEVMNAHRETAITTFKAFMASTEDENTKNAILSFACQAIFSNQPSGYLKNEAESVQNSQIVEIVKSLSGPIK